MNVDRRGSGTSVVAVRILLAGMVLLAAGCMVLGWGSRSRQPVANAAASSVSQPISQNDSAVAAGLFEARDSSQSAAQAKANAVSFFGGLPLMFEPNRGQANLDPRDANVKFIARGAGYAMAFGPEGTMVSLRSAEAAAKVPVRPLQMKLAGANRNPVITGSEQLPGRSNYFLGNDPTKWQHDIPQFSRVRYEDVYPGINLVFYGNQGRLEYDFQIAPGSNPSQAELQFDGAGRLELAEGNLVIKGDAGDMQLEAPRVYQQIAGRQQPVEGKFVLRAGNRVGFAIGDYDRSRELVIDPVLTFSTFFGGSGDDQKPSIAVDNGGNIYLAGTTDSPSLPVTPGVLQSTLKGTGNVFVAEITPAQTNGGISKLDFVTYLGGSGSDSSVGISVDGAGDIFVAGTTSSIDFPTIANTAYQALPESGSTGTSHVFVTELNGGSTTQTAASTLLYSSYLSGNGTDVASGMTIDAHGYIYVTGTTTSTDTSTNSQIQFPSSGLPQAQPFQNASRGPIQFFVTKVNTASAKSGSIAYSTYFGGTNFVGTTPIASGGGIAVDTNGNIYFTGTTNYTYTGCAGCNTTDFPILNAYQPCLDQPTTVVVVNPATCLNTTTFSTSDAFVAKLNPNGSAGTGQLLWSTYVGGSQNDSGTGIALDTGAANVYITGTTNSPDVTALTTFAAYQLCLDTPINPAAGTACNTTVTASDAYVARLSNPTTGSMSLTYFSYLGGTGNDAGLAIAVDTASGALVTGWTQSTDFPVFPLPNSIQSTLAGTQDAFLARFNTVAVSGQNTTGSYSNFFGGTGVDQGTGITTDSNSNTYLAGDTTSTDLQVSSPSQLANAGGIDAFATRFGTATNLAISGVLTLGTNQTYISAGNQATFTYTVTNQGPDLATGLTFLDDISAAATVIPVTFISASTTSGTCSNSGTTTSISCSIGSLSAFATATVTVVLTPTATSNGGAAKFNGGAVQIIGPNNIIFAQTSVAANMSDFSLDVNPKNVTLQAAGDTAVFGVTLTPNPVYGTNISLSCSSGVPTQASCNFTTTPVTLQSSSPGTSTLNLTTTARPVPVPAVAKNTLSGKFYAFFLVVPGLALLGAGVGGRRGRLIGGLFLLSLFPLLMMLPACSSGKTQPVVSGTPAGTYTIVLTATSGTDTKNKSFTLTVP